MDDNERAQLENTLAKGRMSGPRMERLWQAVETRVAQTETPPKKAQGWLFWLAPLALAGVGVVMLVPLRVDNTVGLVARGDDGVAARVEPSCGNVDQPCRASSPVYFRFLGPQTQGVLYVLMGKAGAQTVMAGPVEITAPPQGLPVQLVPESTDVAAGIELQACWAARLWTAEQLAGIQQRGCGAPVVHLTVVPP
jgi:hypothetical protein